MAGNVGGVYLVGASRRSFGGGGAVAGGGESESSRGSLGDSLALSVGDTDSQNLTLLSQ